MVTSQLFLALLSSIPFYEIWRFLLKVRLKYIPHTVIVSLKRSSAFIPMVEHSDRNKKAGGVHKGKCVYHPRSQCICLKCWIWYRNYLFLMSVRAIMFPDFSSWSCTLSTAVTVCCFVLSSSDQKTWACCFPDALSSPIISSFSFVSISYLCFSSFTFLTPLIQLFSFLFVLVFYVLLSQVTQLKMGNDAFLKRLPGKSRCSCKHLSVSCFLTTSSSYTKDLGCFCFSFQWKPPPFYFPSSSFISSGRNTVRDRRCKQWRVFWDHSW